MPDSGSSDNGLSAERPDTSGNAILPASTTTVRKALWWYGAAIGLLGFVVGSFAGLSHSPVVGALLPLLFTLIAGTGGIYLMRLDFSTEDGALSARRLGQVIFVFTAMCLIGAILGIAVRTERFASSQISETATSGSDLIALSTLDARLRMIQTDDAMRKRILRQLVDVDDRGQSRQAQMRALASIRAEAEQLLSVFQEAATRASADAENLAANRGYMPNRTRYIFYQLPKHIEHLRYLERVLAAGDDISETHYQLFLRIWLKETEDLLIRKDDDFQEEANWIERYSLDLAALLRFNRSLTVESKRVGLSSPVANALNDAELKATFNAYAGSDSKIPAALRDTTGFGFTITQ